MKMITSQEEFNKMPCTKTILVEFECETCGKHFFRTANAAKQAIRMFGPKINYCGRKCHSISRIISDKIFDCFVCGKKVGKSPFQIKRRKDPNRVFCSRSCCGKYNGKKTPEQQKRTRTKCGECGENIIKKNASLKKSKSGKLFCNHKCANKYIMKYKKRNGQKVSKLEEWLQIKLKAKYRGLKFDFNKRDAILSELDIFIPSLKLAFELNGIFHYEPIYGQEKLIQTQNNDKRKFQACLEQGIELCIIDSSKMKYFKEQNCIPYLDIITKIIDEKLSSTPVV